MDSYMMELLQTFKDEAEELFEAIDSNLLILEKEPTNTVVINSIFRPIHTLKGSAGMMSLDRTNKLAHAMEDVLDKVRNGKLQCNPHLINLFFEVADCLKALSHAEITGENPPGNHQKLILQLQNILKAGPGPALKVSPNVDISKGISQAAEDGTARDREVLIIRIPFDPDCLMKSSSAFLVKSSLGEIGEVALLEPSCEDPAIEDADRFTLVLYDGTEDVETILERTEIPMMTGKGEIIESPDNTTSSGSATDTAVSVAGFAPPPSKNTPEKTEDENFFVRIPIHNIDEMMGLVEELFVGKSHFSNLIEKIGKSHPHHPVIKKLNLLSRSMDKLTLLLEKKVISIRKVSLEKEMTRFNRLVRDLSRQYDTTVRLDIKQTDIEIDLEMWKKLAVAIEIVLKNIISCNNSRAIEIKVFALYRDADIVISLVDNGNQIRLEGMDQVNGILNSISGRFNVNNNRSDETGNRCSFRVPIDSSRVEVIYFRKDTNIFAVPVAGIEKILKLRQGQVKTVSGKKVIYYARRVVTLMDVSFNSDQLETFGTNGQEAGKLSVVLSDSDRYAAILVDEVLGEDKVLVKKLDDVLFDTDYIIGATVKGDGRVVLVVNPLAFFKSNGHVLEYA